MHVADDPLRNTERHAARPDESGLADAPARRLVVLACPDSRIDPFRLLGLADGDAHVVRSAGGVVTVSRRGFVRSVEKGTLRRVL